MRTILSCLFLAVLFSGSVATAQSPAPKPNIIYITVDDLNDFTGFLNGQPQTFTPNLDRIAHSGTIFENAFTAVPVCAPSRNCFLTGKTAEYTGIYSNEEYLELIEPTGRFRSLYNLGGTPLPVKTLPEWLKDVGDYYTIGMGKVFHGWARDGYDRDYDAANPDPCSRGLSWNEFRDFNPKDDPRPTGGLAGDYGDGVVGVSAGQLNDADEVLMMDYKQTSSAIEFLQDYGTNPGDFCDRPFFLSVGLYRPHEPFTAPERYFLPEYQPDLFQRPYDLPYNNPSSAYPPNGLVMPVQPEPIWSDFDNLGFIGQYVALGLSTHDNFQNFANLLDSVPRFSDTLTIGERKQIVAESRRATTVMAYLASISYMDAQVGRLLEALEANPALAANTIIVMHGDHGLSLGEKKHWFKTGLWETDLRVPLFIRDPRIIGGRVQRSATSLIDIFPTLCDLAGIPVPLTDAGAPYLDGRTLKPGLDGTPMEGLRPAVSVIQLPERFSISCYPFYSVRTERYHLIRYRTPLGSSTCASGIYQDEFELYEIGENREVDPNEWRNLANLPEYRRIRDWLNSFIPGELLAGTIQPVVSIAEPDLGCAPLTSSSVLTLKSSLNVAGTGKTQADFSIRWRINDLAAILIGDSVTLNLELLPASYFSNPTEVVVQALVFNMQGKVVSIDNFLLPLGAGTPDPAFTAQIGGTNQVRVLPAIDFPQSGSDFSRWDFGDGIVLDERIPAPHSYLSPGTYTVTHTRFYGQDLSCSVSATQTVTLHASAFNQDCATPYPPMLQDQGPTAAELQLTSVFNADYYQWRWHQPDHADPVWTYEAPAFSQDLLLTGLPENTRFEVQAKVYCIDGKESEWTTALTFATSPCRPPFSPAAAVTPTTATVSWQPVDESIGGTTLYVFSPGQPLRQVYAGPTLNQKLLTPLTSNKNYRTYLVSLCRDLGGSPTYMGQAYTLVDFRTTAAPLREAAPLQSADGTSGSDLLLWPNPTSGQFQVLAEGSQQLATLRVIADDGKLIRQSTVQPGNLFAADLHSLAPGLYHVEWVEAGITRSIVLTDK